MMKKVKFYWEFTMTDDIFNSKHMQELINEVKSGKFQREVENEKFKTGGKINKCIATVQVQ